MKKSINFSEIVLWVFMLIPFIYLAIIWNDLPEIVPTHYNEKGEADGFGSKTTLFWIPLLMLSLTYGLFWLIPKIDPKQKIGNMGKKYDSIKWIVILLMCAVSFLLIHSARSGDSSISLLFAGLGVFYALLGNYFPAIKHNYFLGIRTPWTLENETVWKKTHRMAGGWWMIGGIIIVATSLLLNEEWLTPIFIGITVVIALAPIIYSYLEFRKIPKGTS